MSDGHCPGAEMTHPLVEKWRLKAGALESKRDNADFGSQKHHVYDAAFIAYSECADALEADEANFRKHADAYRLIAEGAEIELKAARADAARLADALRSTGTEYSYGNVREALAAHDALVRE